MGLLRRAIVWVGLASFAAMAGAAPEQTLQLNIASQPVGDALNEFARQSGLQVVIDPQEGRGVTAARVVGMFTARDALQRLLANTGLRFEYLNERTVAVRGVKAQISDKPAAEVSRNEALRLADADTSSSVAIASATGQNSNEAATPVSAQGSSQNEKLEEIIVTAQKRNERLQDVPVPVTVLDADTLLEHNTPRIQDYFATVPGLSLNAASFGNPGAQTLAIRGVATSANASPTVGVTIDDVPFGSSSVLANGGFFVADLDPADLSHLEVLRGPQGTLYGTSSIGGIIKYVTIDPSTSAVSGQVQMSLNHVSDGEGGYGLRGAINMPVSETLALRASGFARFDPGYVDNINGGRRDVNSASLHGGLMSALWRPSDSVSLKLSALVQDTQGDGTAAIDADGNLQPLLGDLQQQRLAEADRYHVKIRLYTAKLTAKLGNLDFASISGYGVNRFDTHGDNSGYFGVPVICRCYNETDKFTQEFRLSGSGTRLDWLAGAFYTHEKSPADQANFAIDPVSGAATSLLAAYNFPTTLAEYAVFGDLTLHVTDRLDVQVGGRESENRQVYNETDTGVDTFDLFHENPPYVNPTERTKANAFTYLLTPSFKFTPDLMLYARFSSGYRVGGPNFNASLGSIPVAYAPDKTNNYEVGFKGALFDRALTFDASAYYIDWKDIQISLINPNTSYPYNANAGDAKSQGFELSIQARPARYTTITLASSFNDAELKQGFPEGAAAIGFAGDRLPFSSRFSGSLSVNQDIPLAAQWTSFVGGAATYVGSREGEFVTTYTPDQPRLRFPAYTQFDLRAGVRHDHWAANLFANNVFNRRGLAGGGVNSDGSSPFYLIYIQPLTIGLSLSRTF